MAYLILVTLLELVCEGELRILVIIERFARANTSKVTLWIGGTVLDRAITRISANATYKHLTTSYFSRPICGIDIQVTALGEKRVTSLLKPTALIIIPEFKHVCCNTPNRL